LEVGNVAQIQGVPAFVGLAIAVLLGLVVWSIRRGRGPQTGVLAWDDWTGRMLAWLLILAAFVAGAFISYALLRP
jgi:predicted small integral membrane protein